MRFKTNKDYKSIPKGLDFELPKFVVLTGENGTGKTHLFEAMLNSNFCSVFTSPGDKRNVQLIPFAGLLPDVDQECDSRRIDQEVKAIWDKFKNAQEWWKKLPSSEREQLERNSPRNSHPFTIEHSVPHFAIIQNICKKNDIDLVDLTETQLANNLPIDFLGGKGIFCSKFGFVYKTYHIRMIDNELEKIYKRKGINSSSGYLDEQSFRDKYNDPPWEVVNCILERLKLPYSTNDPLDLRREDNFIFKLTNNVTGVEIRTEELSTGEKTLLSLALAIYNTSDSGQKPSLLLLDEPDASLHPSMAKVMLDVLENDIVMNCGIPVILSTHSPTTVACAPPKSLFKITLDNKNPVRCSLQDSINMLAYGLPNLRVSIDEKRQVFVESKYDVLYLDSLFEATKREENYSTLPVFFSPLRDKEDGSNCSDVLHLVKDLRDGGNVSVYGIVDRDENNKPENQIIILGMGNRYSIENYIFEPHLLGLYLAHKRFIKPGEIGLKQCQSYLDVCELVKKDETALQTIATSISSTIQWPKDFENLVTSELKNGTEIEINEGFFKMKGHDLEGLCKATWPQLKSIKKNNLGDAYLKKEVIDTVINDFPKFVSIDIYATFLEIK